MFDTLERNNTTTSSFWTPTRKPSQRNDSRPDPPLHYQHIDDVQAFHPDDNNEPPTSFLKRVYPRSKSDGDKMQNLRASKLGQVEKMSSRERIERWNVHNEVEQVAPLEKWRIEVAKAVEEERQREEMKARMEELQERRRAGGLVYKPSVMTTSSMRSAMGDLRNQLEASSPFARSFAVDSIHPPVTAASDPHTSVIRATFFDEQRENTGEHPYSRAFGFSEESIDALHPDPGLTTPSRPHLTIPSQAQETLLLAPTETVASVSPIDPVFASDKYRFPLVEQRHPLPAPIDTTLPSSAITSAFSTPSVPAPVLSEYQAFLPPPRSSSLPFVDLASIRSLPLPSPARSTVAPPVPPEDPAPRPSIDTSFEILPPKAAALLGLIPSAHAPFAPNSTSPYASHARPPRAPFRSRQDSLSSATSTEPLRSSFYTSYDGPQRPSCDSSTPTTLTSPSLGYVSMSPLEQRAKPIRIRPPPLALDLRREGMSSLPDLHDASGDLTTPSQSSSAEATRGYTSFDDSRRPSPSTSTSVPAHHDQHSHSFRHHHHHHARNRTFAETEVESLLDAPLHSSRPKPPPSIPPLPLPFDLPQPSSSASRFPRRQKSFSRTVVDGGRGLVRKLSQSKLERGNLKDLMNRSGSIKRK